MFTSEEPQKNVVENAIAVLPGESHVIENSCGVVPEVGVMVAIEPTAAPMLPDTGTPLHVFETVSVIVWPTQMWIGVKPVQVPALAKLPFDSAFMVGPYDRFPNSFACVLELKRRVQNGAMATKKSFIFWNGAFGIMALHCNYYYAKEYHKIKWILIRENPENQVNDRQWVMKRAPCDSGMKVSRWVELCIVRKFLKPFIATS